MNRVAILGNAGSGKSFLAAGLGSSWGLPVIALDELFWKPPGQYQTKRPADELMALVDAKRLEPRWIVEGVFGELVQPFLNHADLLIWLDIPWEVSRERIEQRHSRGRRGEDVPAFLALLAYAGRYFERDDGRSQAGHRRLFEAFARHKVHLTSEDAVNEFLRTIRASDA